MAGQQKSQGFADGYIDVATRIVTFREKYPDGSLQPADLSEPVKVLTIGDLTFLQYVACAYRSPDDPRPGVGIAWEPFPGKTPYTRDSEAMVAETSAWGRAIVAALAADTKRGIATAEEVRNRQSSQPQPAPAPSAPQAHTQPPPSAPSPQTPSESPGEHPLLMALSKVPESRKEEAHRFIHAAANGVEWENLPAAKVRALAKQVEAMASEVAA